MGVDSGAGKVHTASAMAIDDTKSISARVSLTVAERLEADARIMRVKPGTLLRFILEDRYLGVPGGAGKSVTPVAKSNGDLEVI